MKDLLAECRLSLTELAKREGVAVSTAWRWALRGVRGIKLETYNAGGKRTTTSESYARFVAALTEAAQGLNLHPQGRTSQQRAAAMSRAEREFNDLGV